ncbi:MAG: response regulator transcription factor [Actinomycetota bacterium]
MTFTMTARLSGIANDMNDPVRETERHTILIVEDAPEFVQLIQAALERGGNYAIEIVNDGVAALERAREIDPDLVVLDLGLPGADGIEVCRELRTFTDAYVLMLTGRDDEVDRLVGLAVGADDYVTKPFSARELAARVQVLLRRPRTPTAPVEQTGIVELGDLRIDTLGREVAIDGDVVELTKLEFDLLATLASRPEMVFTRQLLLESVWGGEWFGDDHLVSVHIANLRKKIDRDGRNHVTTVRGVGYRLTPG